MKLNTILVSGADEVAKSQSGARISGVECFGALVKLHLNGSFEFYNSKQEIRSTVELSSEYSKKSLNELTSRNAFFTVMPAHEPYWGKPNVRF
jgi:hypothetical protein